MPNHILAHSQNRTSPYIIRYLAITKLFFSFLLFFLSPLDPSSRRYFRSFRTQLRFSFRTTISTFSRAESRTILTMSQSKVEDQKKVAAAAAARQSDNIAHALAGAGGGILSMVLTWVHSIPVLG